MKKLDFSTLAGAALLLLGSLLLLEQAGILQNGGGIFWGLVFLGAASFFGWVFLKAPQSNWWAVIPGMALLGMGAENLLPKALEGWGGGLFLGALGIAFFLIYLTERARWWALIPAGTLLTLAAISVLEDVHRVGETKSGMALFLGLGITFLLVALLPNPVGRMQWAYIPALILLIMSGVVGNFARFTWLNSLLPVGLMLAGGLLLFGFFWNRK